MSATVYYDNGSGAIIAFAGDNSEIAGISPGGTPPSAYSITFDELGAAGAGVDGPTLVKQLKGINGDSYTLASFEVGLSPVRLQYVSGHTAVDMPVDGRTARNAVTLTALIDQGSAIVVATDGATVTFDLSLGNRQEVTLGGTPRTLALSNAVVGKTFLLIIKQDGTGSRTVTWFSTIKWAGGSAPTLTTTAGKWDMFSFIVTSTGNYAGVVAGQNL